MTAKLQKQGLFSESAITELLVDLLPVLEYVHSKHIVHRDIKPDNIIVRDRDRKSVLIDFGAVRESMGTVVNSQGNPTSSIVIGTPGYMPSEQAAGRPVYSSDLYSLGVTAIYLLTGKQPQELESDPQTAEIVWRQYASHVNPMILGIIDKAIAYHPRDRYPSARAMLDALQSIANPIPPTQPYYIQQPLTPHPVVSPPPTIPVNSPPSVPNHHRNNLVIGGLIAGGLIGASVIISQVLTKSSQPLVDQNITPSIALPTVTPSVMTTPLIIQSSVPSPTVPPQIVETPQPIIQSPISTNNSTQSDNYFWLSQRRVTNADLDGKDGFTLDIMRNSIFARYGRRFDTPGLQDYFNNQPWYSAKYSPKEFPLKLLSKLEQQNVDDIAKYQNTYNLRYFKK